MRDFLRKKYKYYLPWIDILTIVGSYFLAIFFTGDRIEYFPLICSINVILYFSLFYIFHFYKTIWVHASTSEFIKALFVCLAGGILSYFINLVILPIFSLPVHGLRAGVLATIFITAIFILLRLGLKTYFIVSNIRKSVSQPDIERKNVLIIGAGSAAEICISEMQKSGKYNIVGLIDDAAEKNMLILAESRFWVRAMKLTILPYPVM